MSTAVIAGLLAYLAVGGPVMGAGFSLPQGGLERRSGDGPNVTRIHAMNVDIWPEFDDPRVLVIYRGTLEPGLETPRDFSFLVPQSAEIHMAGAIDENGGHVHGAFTEQDRGDGLKEVSYSLPNPNFYMEFYYDPLGSGTLREFTYPLVSPFPITRLSVAVQHPERSRGFSVDPPSTRMVEDDRGLSYDLLQFDSVGAMEARSVSVRYEKDDWLPSVTPNMGSPAPEGETWLSTRTLVTGGFLLAGVLAFWFLTLLGRRRDESALAPPSLGHRADVGSPGGPGVLPRYCTQCGAAAAAGDRFCGMCGHPLRASAVTG